MRVLIRLFVVFETVNRGKRFMLKNANIFLNFLEKKVSKPSILSRPWKVFIEVALSCNLRCIICTHNKMNFGGIMEDEVFDQIKPILSYARVIHEVGYGEPLIDKKFLEKLGYLKKLGAYVDIYSNGTLLDEQISEQLVKLQLDQITFSIDAGTKETFETIRSGANYSKVLDNIKTLHQIRKRMGRKKPFLRVNYVGMRRNIEELPLAIKTFGEIGVKEVVLSDMVPPDQELAGECLCYFNDVTGHAIQASRKVAERARINLITPLEFNEPWFASSPDCKSNDYLAPGEANEQSFPVNDGSHDLSFTEDSIENINDEYLSLKNRHTCYEPWQTIFVTYNGDVRPCCAFGESFGNLLETDIDDIWNNTKYKLLRKTVNSGVPAFEVCKYCLFRKRVCLSFSKAMSMGVRSVVNNGIMHTVNRTIKYFSEYF